MRQGHLARRPPAALVSEVTMSTRQTTDGTLLDPARIGPHDPRYLAVVEKRFNKRFRANPDYVRLVGSTDEVIVAVEEAVREARRLVVTSGGHCLEGFVSDPEVRVIIDVSSMNRVYYDAERRAIAVEAGATVGQTFQALFEKWGVVVPLGEYPGIGMGGHVVGGAFGLLCRQLGLAADYLYAVEVVTVDEGGVARSVVATRETSDPHRDLWWAHTGGGGGNFGVVTRYWFRSPGASGQDPAELTRMTWLEFALNPFPDLFAAPPGGVSAKVKDALLKKRLTDRQIGVAYDHLTRSDHDVMGGMFGLATYGGRINTVPRDATASAQRDSILDIACTAGWLDPRDEAKNLTWARAFYRDLFSETGGVPIPGEAYSGALINHPDIDLADPALNTSGVPWYQLYYGESYPRLQRIKARWYPRNVFRHALSIRLPGGQPSTTG